MCTRPKVVQETETIKQAKKADASTQKAGEVNRANIRGLAAENIKTSNNGIEDDVISSKKKLLGE